MGQSYLDIYVIGDTQVKPGVRHPMVPIAWDIVEVLPDRVVHLGDHHDFPSLCSYDKGKKSFLSRNYIRDVDAGNLAFEEFWSIIEIGKIEHPSWECEFIFHEGNHEERRHKAIEYGPTEMDGILELIAPDYTGWDLVMPFLKPHRINDIMFSHYIQNEFSDKPICSTKMVLSKRHCSFVQGHKQVLEQEEQTTLDGRRIMGLTMGACYFHDEEYKGPQGNSHFRGTAVLRNAYRGCWEIEIKNLRTLGKRYG